MLTHVYLSHGLESGPEALKVQALKRVVEACEDCEAVVMDYRDQPSHQARFAHLLATLETRGDDPAHCIMAGSSLGGFLSAAVSQRHPVLGCFLLAPALGMPDYPETTLTLGARHTHIIHGWRDDVVPCEPVIEHARRQRLSLRMVDDDHRLHASLPLILRDFEQFLALCQTA
ncbi:MULTISPECIES: YqiA/YcfP family alpha/beta fold hydrolase [unclassified Halomonas]|uniref:YqiA/YcfP family alpha/beta fold hydrolase n=1 Tax=Halomonas sp. S3-1-1 TaxID=2912763 RepID=UPI002076B97B|nr:MULTISPECIES: YqiA/YcfP family alpha/beta fold hydrolase [unclassified Halomonas]